MTAGTPTTIGPYEILGELGRGGMGVVYRARRADAGDEAVNVALKVIGAGEDAAPEALTRFQRESRIAQELDHPGLVRVLDIGQDGDAAWFAMELIEGTPLSRDIEGGEFTWKQAVAIVRGVADALAVAHDKGVLHRDLKPSNILMDRDGKPHIADFGLAKDTRTESKYTRTGQTLGTPAYMSPEQARGDLADLTPASDVWALGCVLYECLAGRRAFEGDTPAAVIGHVITGQPVPIQVSAGDVPTAARLLLDACLSKQPSRRPEDAGALRTDLDRVLEGKRPHHRPASVSRFWPVAVMLLLPIVGGVIAAGWPAGDTRVSANPEAARLRRQGWGLRGTDPGAGATLLGRALAIERDRQDWRLQHGLLCWASGQREGAISAWRAIPTKADERARSRLYLALDRWFGSIGSGLSNDEWDEVRLDIDEAVRGSGTTRQIAEALAARLEGDEAGAMTLLRTVPGWEAALLRAQWSVDLTQRLREFDTGLQQGLRFDWALHNRGFTKLELADYPGAISDFGLVLKSDPREVRSRFYRGLAKQRLGDLHGAIDDYTDVLAIDPRHVAALANRGAAKHKLQDPAGALVDFEAALEIDASHEDALYSLGLTKGLLKDLPGAAAAYTALLKIAPRNKDAMLKLASTKLALQDTSGAVAAYTAFLELEPQDMEVRRPVARLKAKSGDLSGALTDYDAVLAANPDDVVALNDRGEVKRRLGDIPGAIADFTAVLDIDPRADGALVNRGFLRQQSNDLAGALADFNAALDANPRQANALANRGSIKARNGDFAAAMKDLDRAIEIQPRHATALFMRGEVKFHHRDFAGAIADYTAVLEIDPGDLDARFRRADAKSQSADIRGAVADLADLLKRAPAGWPRRAAAERALAYVTRRSKRSPAKK